MRRYRVGTHAIKIDFNYLLIEVETLAININSKDERMKRIGYKSLIIEIALPSW